MIRYSAAGWLYRAAQHPLMMPFATRLLSSRQAADLGFAREHAGRARLSARAIAEYSDDSLSGYGDEFFRKGGHTIETQQRGLILPLLDHVLAQKPTARVLEIGTGNGDIAAEVARRYPQAQVTGIDFSVKTANRVHCRSAAHFIAGYALDVPIHADVVFMSSTAIVFTPAELEAYIAQWVRHGVTDVVLNEPWWSGYRADLTSAPWSRHLEGACWFHQYGAYLKAASYRIAEHQVKPYRHPISARPDIQVGLMWATLVIP